MKIATQHYQDSVITPYGNNHWNGKEKIDISKEKDDAVILEISAKGKRAIQLKEKNEFEQDIVQVDKSAKDLKISVLTTTRAYNELEEEGFITSRQGKGFFVMPRGSDLLREQLIKDVETNLNNAILSAQRASMTDDELVQLLKLLLEVSDE